MEGRKRGQRGSEEREKRVGGGGSGGDFHGREREGKSKRGGGRQIGSGEREER